MQTVPHGLDYSGHNFRLISFPVSNVDDIYASNLRLFKYARLKQASSGVIPRTVMVLKPEVCNTILRN
jgi:hypothetical protein